jgi:hypothetical protein
MGIIHSFIIDDFSRTRWTSRGIRAQIKILRVRISAHSAMRLIIDYVENPT